MALRWAVYGRIMRHDRDVGDTGFRRLVGACVVQCRNMAGSQTSPKQPAAISREAPISRAVDECVSVSRRFRCRGGLAAESRLEYARPYAVELRAEPHGHDRSQRRSGCADLVIAAGDAVLVSTSVPTPGKCQRTSRAASSSLEPGDLYQRLRRCRSGSSLRVNAASPRRSSQPSWEMG